MSDWIDWFNVPLDTF